MPEVGVSKNDASTFKPYNPNEIVGSTSPGLPYIPPQSSNGCGYIITAVVLIAAAVFVPYLAPIIGPAATGVTAAAGAVAGATLTGTAVATGLVTFAAHAAATAVGSAMGLATFSWKQSLGQGIAAGLTAGLAGGLGTTSELLGKFASNPSWIGAGKIAASAVGGALANYAGYEIAGVKGNSFSWKSIAASAVANVVTSAIGNKLGLNPTFEGGITSTGNFAKDFAYGVIGGVVSHHVRHAFGFDEKIDYRHIALSAFANASGNAVGRSSYNALMNRKIGNYLDTNGIDYRIENGQIVTSTPMIGEDGMPKVVEGTSIPQAVKNWIQSGQTSKDINLALNAESMRLGLLNNDLAVDSYGIVNVLDIKYVEHDDSDLFAPSQPNSIIDIQIATSEANRDFKVLNYATQAIGKFGAFAEEHPLLASMSVMAAQATVTGGPVKKVVLDIAKTAGAEYLNIPDVYDIVQRKVDGYLAGNGMDSTMSAVLSHGVAFIADFAIGIGNKSPVDNAKSINKLVNEAGEKLHRHHSMPVFLKDGIRRNSDVKVQIPESMHKELHKDLNVFLKSKTNKYGDDMMPRRGNSGAEIREAFPDASQRIQAMREFYIINQSKYPDVAQDFFRQYGRKP